MELLIVIVGVVIVWKFSSVLNTLSLAARTKSEVMCEEVMMDAVSDRTELIEDFKNKQNEKPILNHSEVLTFLKMKK